MESGPVPSSRLHEAAGCAEPQEADLWQRWRQQGDWHAREQLLQLHLPYARIVAATYYARRVHDEIEFAEYLQLASLGLIESVDRFDPAVGASFRTFAARRMHGAVLDGIERLTEKQQQIAARQRLLAQRRESIGNGAADARPAGRTPEQLLRYVAEAGMAFALAWMLDGTNMIQQAGPASAMPGYGSPELRQLREWVVRLVEALPAQERQVVRSHYLQEMQFDEIARAMRLSPGRVSQVHRRALDRLRGSLREQRSCDVSW